MSRYLVGLTGGLASGKSAVGRLLRERGLLVVDADRLVAELHAPGGAGAAAVRALLGADALRPDGGVDHARVAARIFADPDLRARLEQALHPLVRARFAALARDAEGIAVLEAPLLVEAGFGDDFDRVISVEASEPVRLERAVARGMDRAGARARLAAQGDGAERRAGADVILRNDGDLEDLRRAVDDLAADLRRRAGG